MKKALCIFITSLLLIVSLSSVQAADSYLAMNGFTFDINDSGEAVIHEYDDRTADVVIPARLLEAPVVKIDDYAFFADKSITSVHFENAPELKSIGSCAFYGCTGLENLTLCASLEELGFGAFQNCTKLKTLIIENGLTAIPGQAFYGDTALTSASIPDSVTEISANAFQGCGNVVFYCTKDSFARQYAEENNISYVVTDADMFIIGDANGDDRITISDVTAIQRHLAEIDLLSEEQLALADTNGDGEINIADATHLQMYLAEYDVVLGKP